MWINDKQIKSRGPVSLPRVCRPQQGIIPWPTWGELHLQPPALCLPLIAHFAPRLRSTCYADGFISLLLTLLNKEGDSPLHRAVAKCHLEIRNLCFCPASPQVTFIQGLTFGIVPIWDSSSPQPRNIALFKMITVRPRPVIGAVIAVFILTSFYLLQPSRHAIHVPSSFSAPFSAFGGSHAPAKSKTAESPYGREYKGHSTPEDINRVTNSTLGFSKVFVVGLPERTDKRDAMALTAALTGFDVEWVDGVRGEEIPNKAVPFGIDRNLLMETNLGSWRGHMNAIRRYARGQEPGGWTLLL